MALSTYPIVRDVTLNSLEQALQDGLKHRPRTQALLFDLDGTLINTMPLHFEAYRQVFSEFGGTLTPQAFGHLSGPPAKTTIPLFAMSAGLPRPSPEKISEIHARKKVLLKALLQQVTVPCLAAAKLLQRYQARYRTALVTSGNAEGAEMLLHAAGLSHAFDTRITGDDVAVGKPAPPPYLAALERLGIPPEQGIAFEDHEDGLQSALAAGLAVIDVRNEELMFPAKSP
jgi:HAD superfamily hydrolase (TIGR01509 family)